MKILPHHISPLFDPRYIERGKQYFEEGMVKLVRVEATRVGANCIGTRRYKTELTFNGGRLDGHCSCPAFENFGPCKHMAATAFAVIAHAQETYTPSGRYIERDHELGALERHLRRLKKAELIEIILRHLGDEPDLLELDVEEEDD